MFLIRRLLQRSDHSQETQHAKVREGSWWDRNRPFFEIGATWLEALVALIAAIIAINQYLANSRAEQVNMTLKYLDRYQTERVYNARKTLEDSWSARSKEVFEIMKAPDGESRLATYLEETIAQLQLDPQIATIMEFYDELQACTTAGLCDRDTAVRFFGKFAWDFRGLLAPHIQHQRSEYHDDLIGSGIDYFSLLYYRYKQAMSKSDPHNLLDQDL